MASLASLRALRGLGTRFDAEAASSEAERLLGENAEFTLRLQNTQLRDELFGGQQFLQGLERQQRELRLGERVGPSGFFENPAFIEGVSDPEEVSRFLRLTLDAQGNVVPVGGAIPTAEPTFRRRDVPPPPEEFVAPVPRELLEPTEQPELGLPPEAFGPPQRRLATLDPGFLGPPEGGPVERLDPETGRTFVQERVGARFAKPTAAEQRAARERGLKGLDEEFLAGVKADLAGQREAGTSRLAELDAQIAAARSLQATGIRSGTRLRKTLEEQRGERERGERQRVTTSLSELDAEFKRKSAVIKARFKDADPKDEAAALEALGQQFQAQRRSIVSGREAPGALLPEPGAPAAPPTIGEVTLAPEAAARIERPGVAERAAAVTPDTPRLIRTALERQDQDFDALIGDAAVEVGRLKATRRERRRTGQEFVQTTDRELLESLRFAIEDFESLGRLRALQRLKVGPVRQLVNRALKGVAEEQRDAARSQFTLFVLNELLRVITERQPPERRIP